MFVFVNEFKNNVLSGFFFIFICVLFLGKNRYLGGIEILCCFVYFYFKIFINSVCFFRFKVCKLVNSWFGVLIVSYRILDTLV